MVNVLGIKPNKVPIGQSGTDMNELFQACLRQIKEEKHL